MINPDRHSQSWHFHDQVFKFNRDQTAHSVRIILESKGVGSYAVRRCAALCPKALRGTALCGAVRCGTARRCAAHLTPSVTQRWRILSRETRRRATMRCTARRIKAKLYSRAAQRTKRLTTHTRHDTVSRRNSSTRVNQRRVMLLFDNNTDSLGTIIVT